MKSKNLLAVVSDLRDLSGVGPDVRVVDAATDLAGEGETGKSGLTIVNLCRRWRYLSRGYYVSLLAEARGQRPLPSVETAEGLQHPQARFRALREAGVDVLEAHEVAARLRTATERAVDAEGQTLPPVRDEDDQWRTFFRAPRADELTEVTVTLGRCESPGFQRLAARVYRAWPTPVMRLRLLREDDRWRLYDLALVPLLKLRDDERAALHRALLAPPRAAEPRDDRRLPSIAVLYDEHDPYKASSNETLDRLERIAARRGLRMERIGPSDLARLGEHDALFIRTVTGIDQPAHRFAVRAEALGLPVIDDPRSIIRCSNKIFLHELLSRDAVAMPKTVVFGRGVGFSELSSQLGAPYIVKLPDGSFSGAVFKIKDAADHAARVEDLIRRSPLLVAQAYMPTAFDWRVTVLDGKPLFVARYDMAPGHWQIRATSPSGVRYGRVEAVPRDEAPAEVVRAGLRAARLVGDGLYGVDLKETASGVVVIEVNDNPNLDLGYDDEADGDVIYEDIVSWFERRLPKERPMKRPRPKPAPAPGNDLEALRLPVGRPPVLAPGRAYRAWEVLGIELEYAVVDRDLNAIPVVGEALAALAGRPTSDFDLGMVGYSNELFSHVFELKTPVPLRSLVRTEEVLVEGVRRMSVLLAARFGARLMPGGMHPWMDPREARLWRRSNRRIYETYERLFDVHTHGWANVQATHVNLPLGRESEAVAMMNAAAMVVPYLPAVAASSPMYAGELQAAVDNRLNFIVQHQSKLPASCGDIVPEPVESLAAYRRDVLGRMYKALDALPDAGAIRHEFLNARGAVFKFSRESMEVRVLDVQECVRMDVAIAAFTRLALRAVAADLTARRIAVPDHAVLVEDFRAVIRDGTAARVLAPHLAPQAARGDDGRVSVRDVLADLLGRAGRRPKREEEDYLGLVAGVVRAGNLSERIAAVLSPHIPDEQGFTDAARHVYRQLSECLVENRPWEGRGL